MKIQKEHLITYIIQSYLDKLEERDNELKKQLSILHDKARDLSNKREKLNDKLKIEVSKRIDKLGKYDTDVNIVRTTLNFIEFSRELSEVPISLPIEGETLTIYSGCMHGELFLGKDSKLLPICKKIYSVTGKILELKKEIKHLSRNQMECHELRKLDYRDKAIAHVTASILDMNDATKKLKKELDKFE